MVIKWPFIECYFFANQQSPEMEIFALWVITFEPNKIQTQNKRQFVKDNHIGSWQKKWPEIVVK